jgi:hypothetical protein
MKPTRPKQQLPGEIVADIMSAIRGQFYPDATPKQWMQEGTFIKREFVLYFAAWLDKKGVTLKPERYKQILLERLNEIKIHGKTEAIKYFPGYLKHSLQQHLKFHGEDYYNEGKNLRAQLENTLSKLPGPTVDPVRVMAEARNDLLKSKKKPSKITAKQLPLF